MLRTLSAMVRDDARTRGEIAARQSWTVSAARLAVAAPWLTLVLLCTRTEAAHAYATPAGAVVLTLAAAMSALRLCRDVAHRAAARRRADAAMTPVSSGAMAGLLAGLGVLLVVSWLRARRPVAILDRIAPFVGVPGSAFRRPWPGCADRLVAGRGVEVDGTGRCGPTATWGSGCAGAARRHPRPSTASNDSSGAPSARAPAASQGCFSVATARRPSASAVLGTLGGVAGWACRDAALRRAVRGRQRIIAAHLPTLADLLALAVAAGASPVAALDQAARTMAGPLAEDVGEAVAGIRSGVPVDASLRAFADATGVAPVQRFVDGILIALERGTPLAEVLRAQAADVRADEGRRLMELAGRKDIAMLVPIVFLVLPSVVLVAVFPGISALRIVVP